MKVRMNFSSHLTDECDRIPLQLISWSEDFVREVVWCDKLMFYDTGSSSNARQLRNRVALIVLSQSYAVCVNQTRWQLFHWVQLEPSSWKWWGWTEVFLRLHTNKLSHFAKPHASSQSSSPSYAFQREVVLAVYSPSHYKSIEKQSKNKTD